MKIFIKKEHAKHAKEISRGICLLNAFKRDYSEIDWKKTYENVNDESLEKFILLASSN